MSDTQTPAPQESVGEIANQQANEGSITEAVSEATTPAQNAVSQLQESGVDVKESANSTPENKKYKVKIDGKEVEVTEDELLKGYQSSKSASKRFNEAAKMRKEADQLIEFMKTQPVQVIEQLGHNFREIAEQYLIQKLEEESMDPKDRELLDAKRKLQEYEEREKQLAQQREQEEYAKMKSSYEEQIDTQISDTLQKSGLPKTPYTVKRMAQYLSRALENNLELAPNDVVELVRKDYYNDLTSYLGGYDGDKLLEVMPKDVVEKIRKAELAKVKAKTAPTPTKVEEVAKPKSEDADKKNKKKMSMASFREWADKASRE